MALSIGCIYHARNRNWLLSGILGGLAALTRSQGVFLALAVGWEYWQVIAEHYAPQRSQGTIINRPNISGLASRFENRRVSSLANEK